MVILRETLLRTFYSRNGTEAVPYIAVPYIAVPYIAVPYIAVPYIAAP